MFVDLNILVGFLSITNRNVIIEGIVHNVIEQKIIIRRFLNYFCKKYRRRKKYWKSFKIIKDFHLIEKKKDN